MVFVRTLEAYRDGKTGAPFIDAVMVERANAAVNRYTRRHTGGDRGAPGHGGDIA